MFLIVVGMCVLFTGILLYWTRAKWSDARQAFDKAAAERSRLQNLDPFPNDANYRKLKVHLENYTAALDKVKEELKKEVAPDPPLAPNEFQECTLGMETCVASARTRSGGCRTES